MDSITGLFSERELLEVLLLTENATAIYSAEEVIIQTASDTMIAFWGKDRGVIGQPLAEAVPELAGQPFIGILQNVWRTGKTYESRNAPALLLVNGQLQTFYFDFVYRAIKTEDGQMKCILHTANDVTDRVADRERLLEKEIKEQQLSSELEEIIGKLSATNTTLTRSQQRLVEVNSELLSSEAKLEQILSQLPAPVVVLTGQDQVIETTNESLLRFWDKKREEVIGRPMLEVFPELKDQPFPAQWKHVLTTGQTIANLEKPVYFNRPGGKRLFYVDYHYQPLKNLSGKVTGVLATIIDNTDKVTARIGAQQAEAQLRLAIEASQLGTWYFDIETGEFRTSERMKVLFGYRADEEMPFEAALMQINEADREQVLNDFNVAVNKGKRFDQEYTVKGYHDHQLRWIKASGQLYKKEKDQPVHFSGTVQDVTEQKQDDQRKNDFIGMVSHELKTPLTTINGYLQILQSKARKTGDRPALNMFEKTNMQVRKMTAMINGFLNVSRLESGKIHIERGRFDMADLIKESEEESVATITSHHVEFAPVVETFVMADRDKIGHVITNLISNAVKYSPAGSTISVACVTIEGMARVSVQDEGIGISQQNISKLFERYYRTEDVKASAVSGFGIGLYLSAEIVRRHEGRIWVESEAGKGSTFYFSLPVISSM